MEISATRESQPFENTNVNSGQHPTELAVLHEVRLELTSRKKRITDKDIILALILRLETEHNEAVQNIYRNALEMVVLSTQNDTQS
ncbi:biofilm development regulator YmgB/AriR family protein [Enterobacter cancerogenus]|jgi:probable RcsB/C two-component-system connector, global regulator of biofilm formation and acid-resistance|uniref:biofilm development regulator YmgB/AriR family protein n=1 Tax=Enterobacter cancerogenus TaxID=69218 RepID=UPI0005369CCE|nr:biofilm development regulator YmgB/AriR family protein [Enterobacter cancerogenus]KGT89205.1 hypothetical protein NH00_16410 [Enterobacter cancerogenus]